MPKHVKARAAQEKQEEHQVRQLAKSHHAPADWKFHAQMVVESWAGKTPQEIATELGCHAQTVRIHLARFNAEGVAGLGMAEHPRLHHVFIPKGACWLNLQEGWWRLFRRDALAGQSFANSDEIEQATRVATAQLNRRANPWIWSRPTKDHRHYRRLFSYRL